MPVVKPKDRIGLEELWVAICSLSQKVERTLSYGSRPRKPGLLHNILRK